MKLDRSTRLVLLVALSLTLAGCAGLVGDDDTAEVDPNETADMAPDEIQAEALAAMEDIETVAFDLEQTSDVGVETTGTMNGVIDEAADEMQFTMDTGPFGEFETYLIEETAYVNLDGQWFKMDLSTFEFEDGEDEYDLAEDLLEAGDLTVIETKTFEGHEVWVVEYDVDSELFEELYGQEDLGYGIGVDTHDVTLENGTVTQYIDTDTYYVRYTETNLTMDSAVGSMTSITEMTLSDFNEPANIELPPEAEDAIEIDEDAESPFDDMDTLAAVGTSPHAAT